MRYRHTFKKWSGNKHKVKNINNKKKGIELYKIKIITMEVCNINFVIL